ncbi:restriction endonuclease [Tenacibaculum skagerrakense]|uniref:Restriction endonuclease n=1 Tax=Tenacibaculum skagerrakense TaxID=186571 RepID=A0A4R2P1P0_9FLAO|nr:restriction endonuclease [Tenacibaculum skagerrakense]TCP27854.1 restriction endonuclease [Tenacibaculum skagerrakense]
MKISDIKKFVEHLKVINKNRFYLSEEFIKWNSDNFKMSENESAEVYEINANKITRQIKGYIESCESKHIFSEFKFDEFDSDVLINTKFLEGKDQKDNIEYKLEWRNKFYELLKQIDWREFELLGQLILTENHIENIQITKSQKDQGIDFYGYFSLKNIKSLPRFYNYFKFRIIGQVKHSEKNKGVDHQKVASFGTEINKLRKTTDKSYFVNLDDDFINSKWPILGIFITNSYYPIKAKDFANEYGIIYWDGEQISQDLATKKNIDKLFDEISQDLSLEKLKVLIKEISK